MTMTNEEIVRDYTQAANKGKQIKILADLNCVSPGEIRAVLAAAGVPGIRAPERIRRRKAAAAEKPQPETASAASAPLGWPPEGGLAVAGRLQRPHAFWEHTEAILAALPDELPPEAENIVQNLPFTGRRPVLGLWPTQAAQRLQTLFADYIGRRLEGRARHGS